MKCGNCFSVCRQYLENIRVVDKGIERITAIFEDVFDDGKTAYIFTADHGMTNWGMIHCHFIDIYLVLLNIFL